ncbi:MAG: phosphoglucomutase/phosphomannomutase family protein [Bacteroidia bacterium]|nr:phosphoglucomutase/phosphomannomutase family protein [Bacteroidia bacterium]
MIKQPIKFGTDGWRAIIAEDFTTHNLSRVAKATALWIHKNYPHKLRVAIGYDCRFMGAKFAQQVAETLTNMGIEVVLSNSFCSTPMISLATVHFNCAAGIIITASHNPPEYSGYKIKGYFGGPATPEMITEVENLIDSPITQTFTPATIQKEDFEALYINHLKQNFDIDLIRKKVYVVYDAMYGAGQRVLDKLALKGTFLHCEYNPSFMGQAPEPIHKNLAQLSKAVSKISQEDQNQHLLIGLATDGDADRIGLYDENGRFIDSHHILLLLIYYLHKEKGLSGKIVTTFSCTQKIAELCKKYNLPHEITKIGFKYICQIMLNEKVIVGGEESGGIAIIGNVPERDGIFIGLTIMEFMAKTGKKLSELVKTIYSEIGTFAMERYDLHVSEVEKQHIITQCKNNTYTHFGSLRVKSVENIDGYKFHFENSEWVMIRPSGTEPILRVYAEAATSERAFEILNQTKNTILSPQNS